MYIFPKLLYHFIALSLLIHLNRGYQGHQSVPVFIVRTFSFFMIFQSVFFLIAACYGSFIHSLFLKDVSFPITSYLQEIHMEEEPGKCSSLAEIELVCEYFLPLTSLQQMEIHSFMTAYNCFSLLSCVTIKLLLANMLHHCIHCFKSYFP